MLTRLRRVTDLFTEGAELVLGFDDDGSPVIVWVNKPNSFEVEEARRDAQAARSDRLIELEDPENAEIVGLNHTISKWSKEELVTARINQESDEAWFEAANDIESNEEWREKLDYLQRMPVLLADADPEDPRRKRLDEYSTAYMKAIGDRMEEIQKESRADLMKKDDADLREEFREKWSARASLDIYMREKRVTELMYALRDCQATRVDERWDHSPCDGHPNKLVGSRPEVRLLPDLLVQNAIEALDRLEIGQKASGNSAAPESSSASSEQPNEGADSTPSTQAETSPDATTT